MLALRKVSRGVVVKLDLEKAYDHVNWEFLLYVPRRCGFGVRRREWIRKCINLVSFSVLVNGVPKGHFGCSRGLRQGDLVAGLLGGMLGKVAEVGMFEGFSPGSGNVRVSHLQFADDTIIFCDNSQRHIRMLRCVLRCFEAVPGLKLNLTKSSLITVGDVPNLDQLAADLAC